MEWVLFFDCHYYVVVLPSIFIMIHTNIKYYMHLCVYGSDVGVNRQVSITLEKSLWVVNGVWIHYFIYSILLKLKVLSECVISLSVLVVLHIFQQLMYCWTYFYANDGKSTGHYFLSRWGLLSVMTHQNAILASQDHIRCTALTHCTLYIYIYIYI